MENLWHIIFTWEESYVYLNSSRLGILNILTENLPDLFLYYVPLKSKEQQEFTGAL